MAHVSRKFAKINQMITGLGAAVVIIGAMFKINHWVGATEMLIAGLTTEAIIFSVNAFLPIPEELNWALVYPELAESEGGEISEDEENIVKEEKTGAETLDELIKNNVDPSVIINLGKGLTNLSTSVSNMGTFADATIATSEYAGKVKEASRAVSELNLSYGKAVDAVSNLSKAGSDAQGYQEQVQQITKNLSSLNSVYEIELQDANHHIKALNKFYGNMAEAMGNMGEVAVQSGEYKTQMTDLVRNLGSVNNLTGAIGLAMENMNEVAVQSEEYKNQITALNKHLSNLNTVYGNMLSAMSVRG